MQIIKNFFAQVSKTSFKEFLMTFLEEPASFFSEKKYKKSLFLEKVKH